jgi:hypothetical protein
MNLMKLISAILVLNSALILSQIEANKDVNNISKVEHKINEESKSSFSKSTYEESMEHIFCMEEVLISRTFLWLMR